MNTEIEEIWLEFISCPLRLCGLPQASCASVSVAFTVTVYTKYLAQGRLWEPTTGSLTCLLQLMQVLCSPELRDHGGLGTFLPWRIQVTLSQLSVIPMSIDTTVWMSKCRKL